MGTLALFAAGSFTVEDADIAAFKAWHRPPVDATMLQRPLPALMELHPGMSSVTQVLPENVRLFLVKRFSSAGFDELTWSLRWREIEDRLLEDPPRDAFEALESLEALGQEAFEEYLIDAGLVIEDVPPLKGARAARFFLLTEWQREQAFESLVITLETAADPQLEKAITLLERQGLANELNEENRKELAFMLLHLHRTLPDLSQAEFKAPLMRMLEEKSSEFRRDMGFDLPEPDRIYKYLMAARFFLKEE